jgi:hypothetical protein
VGQGFGAEIVVAVIVVPCDFTVFTLLACFHRSGENSFISGFIDELRFTSISNKICIIVEPVLIRGSDGFLVTKFGL